MINRNSSIIFLLPLMLSPIVFPSTISVQDSFSNTLTQTSTATNVTQNDNENVTADCADYIRFYAFTLYSPINRTYYSNCVPLELSFSAGMGIRYTLNYTLDGTYGGTIPFEVENSTELHVMYPAKGYLMLPELSEGNHNLTINLFASGYVFGSPYFTGSVQFTVNAQNQPDNIPEFNSSPILLIIMSVTVFAILLRKKSITQNGDDKEK